MTSFPQMDCGKVVSEPSPLVLQYTGLPCIRYNSLVCGHFSWLLCNLAYLLSEGYVEGFQSELREVGSVIMGSPGE